VACAKKCVPSRPSFLKKDYSITGYTREEMVHKKEKLYEMGRVIEGLVYKWNEKNSPVRRAFDAELA
jgi:NADH-quinone oxidoreductase subunit I